MPAAHSKTWTVEEKEVGLVDRSKIVREYVCQVKTLRSYLEGNGDLMKSFHM